MGRVGVVVEGERIPKGVSVDAGLHLLEDASAVPVGLFPASKDGLHRLALEDVFGPLRCSREVVIVSRQPRLPIDFNGGYHEPNVRQVPRGDRDSLRIRHVQGQYWLEVVANLGVQDRHVEPLARNHVAWAHRTPRTRRSLRA